MIWSLQILRFVAALMVAYAHSVKIAMEITGSNGWLPLSVQMVGRAGVDIFFVISGVIISKVAVGLSWQEFAWRRLRRVLPLYLLVCIPTMLVAAKGGFGWREAISTLLLWPATDVMTAPLLTVAWSLCFEMLFYIAAALVLWRRTSIYLLLGLFGVAMTLRHQGPLFQFLGNPIIIEFLLGVGVARLPPWRPASYGILIGAAALVAAGPLGLAPGGITIDYLTGENAGQRLLVYGIPAALIVFGTMQIKTRPSFWTEQGDASYSLYLTHILILLTLLQFWRAHPIASPDLISVLSTIACVVFGWAVHTRIEKPLLNALSHRRRRDPATAW